MGTIILEKRDNMRKKIALFFWLFTLTLSTDITNAALTTIGTAQFNGADTAYNLIWDDENNNKSLVWLDYSHPDTHWTNQLNWAAGLNIAGALSYNIDPSYSVIWSLNPWRLPSAVDGRLKFGYDGNTTAGYNITNSELGHLFYSELDNFGYYSMGGIYQPSYGLQNTENFINLVNLGYWFNNEVGYTPSLAWAFYMNDGGQGGEIKQNGFYGIAVREAIVSSSVSPIPIHGSVWLLGSGLIGLVKNRRTK